MTGTFSPGTVGPPLGTAVVGADCGGSADCFGGMPFPRRADPPGHGRPASLPSATMVVGAGWGDGGGFPPGGPVSPPPGYHGRR